jgi:Family of unknown function (DUF6159)
MGRVSRGWELLSESWAVLRQDKQLILFPILSSVVCILVMASFALPFIAIPELGKAVIQHKDHADDLTRKLIGYGIGFVFYFVSYFIVVFFNVALVSCAFQRFRGEEPTLNDGLSAAFARLPQIAGWALLAASVGTLLRVLEDRLSFLGKIVIGLIGMAWSIATYFVVPVLTAEGVGPVQAVKRSSKILMKTWGESLVGNISLGVIGLLLYLPAILLIGGGIAAGAALQSVVIGVVIGGIGLIYLMLVAVTLSAIQQVFLAGTYLYASKGTVAPGFSEELFQNAFRRK